MATRSCFIVAVETLIDHSHLVHHLDIHQPNNSPRACASFKGTTRFSGVVPLSVGSKRVAAAGLVWPRRETSCPTGASGPPRDVAGAPRLKLGAAKTVRPHADALQQSERVQARGSLRGSPSHRVAAIVRSTSEHASSYFQRAGRGRGRS